MWLLLVVREIKILRTWPKPQPARVIARPNVLDPWIKSVYPRRFHGEHGEEPSNYVRSEHRYKYTYGEQLTGEQLDELVVDAAFDLEFRARRVFASHQFRGILQGKNTLVWDAQSGTAIEKLLSDHQPGPEARRHLDRALAWWATALDHGMGVYEWDRPGYDDVTNTFRGLLRFARAEVAIDPRKHGVEQVVVEKHVDAFHPPAPVGPFSRMALGLVAVVTLHVVLSRGHAPVAEPQAPRTCTEQQQQVEVSARRARTKVPALEPLIKQVLAQVRDGRAQEAFALFKAQRPDDPLALMLEVELLLLTTCEPKPGHKPFVDANN